MPCVRARDVWNFLRLYFSRASCGPCICVCVRVCIYIYIYIYIYICIYMHACINIFMYTHTHTHTHTQEKSGGNSSSSISISRELPVVKYPETGAWRGKHLYVYACVRLYAWPNVAKQGLGEVGMHIYLHICTYTHALSMVKYPETGVWRGKHLYMCVCMRLYACHSCGQVSRNRCLEKKAFICALCACK